MSPMAPERSQRLAASPPLFENRFLDFFSRVHPSVPAIVFVPVIVLCIWAGVDGGYGALATIGLLAAGLLIWTLTEYWLHRLVFHWQPTFPGGEKLHFIIHGVTTTTPTTRCGW